MDLDILCKVVDNFGDIGFAYRLARSLSEQPDPPRLRLVVDDLAAFAALEPAVDPSAACQRVRGCDVYRWGGEGEAEGANAEAASAFRARRPSVVLECFACGRPDWLEAILFDPASGEERLIVDIEHLTAESYAEDFHRMPGLTRSKSVRKAIFMPGFAARTGGLLMDSSFVRARERASSARGRIQLRRELLASVHAPSAIPAEASLAAEDRFWITVFSYERDYSRIVADLARFGAREPIIVLVAAGRSRDCFLAAWSDAGSSFPVIALPFLAQGHWDELLLACDFSIIRGEDSWARAALAGKPFLWQAYPQESRHQLVKVAAFLDRLRPHFTLVASGGRAGTAAEASAAAVADALAPGPGTAFSAVQDLYYAFNDRDRDRPGESGREELLPALAGYRELLPGFRAFSEYLVRLPDLASSLLTFLREIV